MNCKFCQDLGLSEECDSLEKCRKHVLLHMWTDARKIRNLEAAENEIEFQSLFTLCFDWNSMGSSSSAESCRSQEKAKRVRTRNGKTYKCDHCSREFGGSTDLKRHIHIHTGEKPFKCERCGRKFKQLGHLNSHIRIHADEKKYKCRKCDETFSRDGLKLHAPTHNDDEGKKYKCDHCSQIFGRLQVLKQHILIHTGEKPFKCEMCCKSFRQHGHLRRHVQTHTGEKPFKCETCGKEFPSSYTLKLHVRIHTGKKSFECKLVVAGVK